MRGIVTLRFCTIEPTDWGCITRFPGAKREVGAWPENSPDYREITARLGYGDDTLAYCREHEFSHAFVAERIKGMPSYVLLRSVDERRVEIGAGLFEEAIVQMFQRWLRAGERPILGVVDWDALKRDALALLEG